MVMGRSTWAVGMIMVVALAAATRHAATAVSCPQAITKLLPCQGYLTDESSSLSPQCCDAASGLNGLIHGKPDIISLCECFKTAAATFHVIADRAKSLPQMCHIDVPVPIDPNVDCTRI